MSGEVYPVFREYSIAVKKWLIDLFKLPRFERVSYNIVSMTRKGTTDGGVNQHEIKLNKSMIGLTSDLQFKAGHTIKVEGSTNNDEIYLISAISKDGFILILDKTYRSIKSEQTSVLGTVKRCLNVVYGDMQRSVALIATPLRQGTVDSPGIGFYLTDQQMKFEKSRPKESYYTRHYKDSNTGAIIGVAAVPPLMEYEIRYSINIWSVYSQEMDILLYQIMSEFCPQKWFWIGDDNYGFDFTGDRMDRENKGQWAHCIIESVSDASELEPGDATERILRQEISITIENAYMPQPFDDKQSMIGALNIEMEAEINKQERS